MNPNQSNPEIQGNPPVETTPVEVRPLELPVEDRPQQVENSETIDQTTPSEQVQTVPPITKEAQLVQKPVLSEAEINHRLNKVVHGDVNSLSDASRLVEETSFED